jgi:hypothetical protein
VPARCPARRYPEKTAAPASVHLASRPQVCGLRMTDQAVAA